MQRPISNPKRVPEARLKMWVPYGQAFLAFLVVKCAGKCWSWSFGKFLFSTRSQHQFLFSTLFDLHTGDQIKSNRDRGTSPSPVADHFANFGVPDSTLGIWTYRMVQTSTTSVWGRPDWGFMAYSGALVLTWACCFSYAGSVSPLLRRAIDSKGQGLWKFEHVSTAVPKGLEHAGMLIGCGGMAMTMIGVGRRSVFFLLYNPVCSQIRLFEALSPGVLMFFFRECLQRNSMESTISACWVLQLNMSVLATLRVNLEL